MGYPKYKGKIIEGFSPVPNLCLVPQTINTGATFPLSTTNYNVLKFRATGDIEVYLNTDTTKIFKFDKDTPEFFILNENISLVNFKNPGGTSVTLYLWGM